MKNVFYLTVLIFITASLFSCTKVQESYKNSKVQQTSLLKVAPGVHISVSVTFKAGHDGPGSLCYFPYLGDWVSPATSTYQHVPCVGSGENCTWTIGISTAIGPGSITLDSLYSATVTLLESRSETSIQMPARSFLMNEDFTTGTAIDVDSNDEGYWINLPAQSWTRIDSIHYTLSTGYEVSTSPDYLNAP